jgi:hypothetical protein
MYGIYTCAVRYGCKVLEDYVTKQEVIEFYKQNIQKAINEVASSRSGHNFVAMSNVIDILVRVRDAKPE